MKNGSNSRTTKPLVSIIIPVFNAEKYLPETIKTVKTQTQKNWELLLINDGSTDNSLEIAKDFEKDDDRIHVFSIKNSGAAVARNVGIEKSTGHYICFIDADDLWEKTKLKKQIEFMIKNDCSFSFTSYKFADSSGHPNGRIVNVPEKISYKQALKNTTIWTSTVMFDMNKLNKNDIMMPEIPSEDTATWWKVLKKVDYAYGLDDVLSFYRRSKGTLSSKKTIALKRTWNLYRNIEHLSRARSLYCFISYCFMAIKRRV